MIFFGWGRRSKTWKLKDEKTLTVTWKYAQILWCPVAYNITWHLAGDSRSQDQVVSYDRVKELFPNDTPKISWWQRYGMLIIWGPVILNVIIQTLVDNV